MKNLELRAIFTRSTFLSAYMLIILMDSQAKGKQQFQGLDCVQTTWMSPRTPSKSRKGSRWQKRRSSSVEVMVVYAASESPGIPGVNLKGWDHSLIGKMLPSGAPGEIFFFKKVLVAFFTCRGVTAAASVLWTSGCPVVRRCYRSAWHMKDYLVKA